MTATFQRFDDVPVVPRNVAYAPTRDGRQRWAVRLSQLTPDRIGEGVPSWHVWNRELADHFQDRIDTVVHVGGYVRTKGEVVYVTVTSTRFAERPYTLAEWEEASDVERQLYASADNLVRATAERDTPELRGS
jgi:hypothetical protein